MLPEGGAEVIGEAGWSTGRKKTAGAKRKGGRSMQREAITGRGVDESFQRREGCVDGERREDMLQ